MKTTSDQPSAHGLLTPEIRREKEARLDAILAEITQLPALLIGSLQINRNRRQRKDGSQYISPQHYTLQIYLADGSRRSRRIPRKAKEAVEEHLRAGWRFQALVKEYASLATELTWADGSKKND